MKKNININLCGIIYAIDEDAYQLLEQYLDNIKAYFSRQEGGEEIADDIEHRVAELLWEKKQQGVEAIDVMTIKTILKQIGNPEQMTDNESASARPSDEPKQETAQEDPKPHSGIYGKQEAQQTVKKRLFRDPRDKKLGGVLSGLAHYLGMNDPLALRVGFVLLMLLVGPAMRNFLFFLPGIVVRHILFSNSLFWVCLFLYALGWILIPEAKTAEDRLMMKGKPVTPETIKEEVLDGEEADNKKKVETATSNSNDHKGCAEGCLWAVVTVIKLFLIFIGGIILLGMLFALFVCLLVVPFHPDTLASSVAEVGWGTTAASILVGLLVLGIPLYLLYQRFISKSPKRNITWILVVLWLAACLAIPALFSSYKGHWDLQHPPFYWYYHYSNHPDDKDIDDISQGVDDMIEGMDDAMRDMDNAMRDMNDAMQDMSNAMGTTIIKTAGGIVKGSGQLVKSLNEMCDSGDFKGNINIETSHSYTDRDGSQVTVKHIKRRDANGLVETYDTIRTPQAHSLPLK